MLPFLSPETPFPPLEKAVASEGGLLALGGGLAPARLLDAYRRGIFPWGTLEGHPVWYAPDPRMVVFPAEVHVSHTLRKTLRRGRYQVSVNTDFAAVIDACAQTARPGQAGTWISPEMRRAYLRMHELGWAHSVEVRMDNTLTGGLYGLALGNAFFGESMFSWRTDSSKIAFAHLARLLDKEGVGIIDCQMHTRHLASLGGREIPRHEFVAHLTRLIGPFPELPQKRMLTTPDLAFEW